jgi:hypothetical protein
VLRSSKWTLLALQINHMFKGLIILGMILYHTYQER